MERVTTHEVDGWEGETILTMRTNVRDEKLGCSLEFFVFLSALLSFADILLDDFSIFFDVESIFFQS